MTGARGLERARRPFVDQPLEDVGRAGLAASEALAIWHDDTKRIKRPLKLLRTGMNALFVTGDVVIRVGSSTASARLSHDLASSLAGLGVATTTPVAGWWADVAGFAVTAWERVAETAKPVDWEAVGAAVRRVHEAASFVPVGYPVPSPLGFPWWDFETMLADVAQDIDDRALDGLRDAVRRNAGWRESMCSAAVVCHGDVHPGNVLVTASGPLLIDWDLLCWAPPAWDHAMLTTHADRWGGSAHAYPAFAGGYGVSLADDELTIRLGELRNVAATLMRIRAGRTHRAARDEAERRLRFWRGDRDAPMWVAQ